MQRIGESLRALSDTVLSSKASTTSQLVERGQSHWHQQDETDNYYLNILPLRTKIEFPRFSGDDPTEWFNRVAQFFEFQRTPKEQKVGLATFHLEGEANQWWQWLNWTYKEENWMVTWTMFSKELWARFGPTDGEDFDEALSRVRQTGSLRDYQREFEKLGNRVQGWSQKALVGTFMGGLKSEIADGIRMFKPKTLKEAIGLARMKDEQLARQRRFARPIPQYLSPANAPQVPQTSPVTPKRLSWEEMQKRRVQGLCFGCNVRFTPCHKCQGPQLLLLECHTDNQSHGDSCGSDRSQLEGIGEEEPEISMYAITEWTSPRTMQITATIGTQEVMVLIGSGSTQNFLSDRIVDSLRLPVVLTKAFTVHVANGERLLCQGRFDKVPVVLQGIPFSFTFYSLQLAGLDMVLGVQWLEMLGFVVCNWKQLTMDFKWENQAHRLQGIQKGLQATSLKITTEEHHQGQMVFAIYAQAIEAFQWDDVPTYMLQLLRACEDIFRKPTKLPPLREIKHHIPLKKGHNPSMFVHTDYRALNAATVKDRFPIPSVHDMLDELHGAAYFTKLDLRACYHQWNEEVEEAFTRLKQAMTTTPILAMPNFSKPFIIETDASGDGIGAVLTQQGRPIAFISRALGVSKRPWSIYAKEMLAIVEAVRTWRPYIQGRKFFIQTDQRSLKYFLDQRVATSEQQKWVAKLLGYDYEILYRSGRGNSAADALSRRANSPLLNPLVVSQVSLWDDIRKAAKDDAYLQKLFQQAASDPTRNYSAKNGLCFYKNRVVVPTALREQLL
ncbi:PREDICTED: uncharacterized protein LOC109114217 [Nelumbo nucifera]|uniref:Uncharacterized protein LOC109114217 n=1 Tax=Nelumbo nucifera TaxID=4432 RepID=A0A1U8PZX1_NELNU|nr:PREDICTED: uncharacterized protein LOC109114217 [Nelumbo nucifera]